MHRMDVIIFDFNMSNALSNVSKEELVRVKEKLEEIGVSEFDDLKEVREEDLCGLLKPIQARKLIKLWKSESHEKGILPPSTVNSPCTSSTSSILNNQHFLTTSPTCTSNSQPPDSPNLNARWSETFEIDYKLVPNGMMNILLKKKKPPPKVRRAFVRNVGDQIQQVCLRPLKKDVTIISNKIIEKFPCLGDKFFDEAVGTANESLLKSIIYRCENTNRVDTNDDEPLKPPPNSNELNESAIRPKSSKRKQCYGTVNSHPDLPLDGVKSLVEKKKKLKDMYLTNHKNYDEKEVKELMQETYYLQRSDLNAKVAIASIIKEWPFLFERDGMLLHFNHLVGFEIDEKFKCNFQKKSQRVLDFIEGQSSNPDDAREVSLLEFLEGVSKSLKEDLNFMIIEGDSEISKREAELLENLPKTPCIIACGNKREAKNFMLSVDCTVINESCSTLIDSFLMLFATYYVFNIAYPEEACATLEFIQRCYLGINPDRGCKRQKNNGKSKVNPKLLAFLDKLSSYEWL